MKGIKFKNIFIPAVSLFSVCFLITLLLVFTNRITRPVISDLEKERSEETRKTVLKAADRFEDVNGAGNSYRGLDNSGNTVGYVFTTSQKGYGGEILLMVGVSIDDKIEGVEILSQNETPGLGANAGKASFKGQYIGDIPKNGFEVVKGEAHEGQIEAMTGATISSRAVTDAVNDALKSYENIKNSGRE